MIDPIYLMAPPLPTEIMHCEKHGDVPFSVNANLNAHCTKCYDEQLEQMVIKARSLVTEKQLKIITAGSLRDYSMGYQGSCTPKDCKP